MSAPRFVLAVRALLAEGRAVRFRATGRSMEPSIPDGALVTAEPPGARAPRRGDVLLYEDGPALRAHRLRRLSGVVCVVRADAPGSLAERIPLGDVLGFVDAPPVSFRALWRGFRARAQFVLDSIRAEFRP